MSQTTAAGKTFLQKLLDGVEIVGNKVPHPAVIFLLMSAIVIVLSHLFHLLGTSVTYQVIDPVTHKAVESTAVVNSLLTAEGIRFIITSVVRNFLGFTPVGVILVAMVGVGLAEEAGLVNALIPQDRYRSPPQGDHLHHRGDGRAIKRCVRCRLSGSHSPGSRRIPQSGQASDRGARGGIRGRCSGVRREPDHHAD